MRGAWEVSGALRVGKVQSWLLKVSTFLNVVPWDLPCFTRSRSWPWPVPPARVLLHLLRRDGRGSHLSMVSLHPL